MLTSQVISAIESRTGPAKSNGPVSWLAKCPAHEDKSPSLSITEAPDGKTLLRCYAGCQASDVCLAIGIELKDLFPTQPAHKMNIVATYGYEDENGTLLYQVCRLDPKSFRQRHRDPVDPDKWLWKMDGVRRVPFRLPQVIEAIANCELILIVEGEKDCLIAVGQAGMTATCNAGGAGKWSRDWANWFQGADVFIVADKDEPGRKHAADVATKLHESARQIHGPIELPDTNGQAVKDVADYFAAGGTSEQFRKILDAAPLWEPPAETKPCVTLPSGFQTITNTATQLGELLSKTSHLYQRGGLIVALDSEAANISLRAVKSASMASEFETVAQLVKITEENGEPRVKPAICSESTARLIMEARPFRNAMPPIKIISPCPVLTERDRQLVQICGYDRASGIYAQGQPAPKMAPDDARRLLCGMMTDFKFASPSDQARALAATLTPALVFGGLLKGRAPVDLGEADQSQTGKGFRNKLTAAIYRQEIRSITQKTRGVGSLEESFNKALINGANFIALDNIRGKLDSPAIESFLTEDVYSARVPYSDDMEIDPKRVVVMFTSNKADITIDLANRASCVRILKQADGYQFGTFAEGNLLDHIRANQPRYLGAVFSLIQEWHRQGSPTSNECRHDFRPWAQALDWICQTLLATAPLMDGHRETQHRMTNPAMNWLRDLAVAVIHAKANSVWLRANQLVEIASDSGIEIPGLDNGNLDDENTRAKVFKNLGRKLASCFKENESLTIDAIAIKRQELYDSQTRNYTRFYRFDRASIETPHMDAQTNPPTPEADQTALCVHGSL